MKTDHILLMILAVLFTMTIVLGWLAALVTVRDPCCCSNGTIRSAPLKCERQFSYTKPKRYIPLPEPNSLLLFTAGLGLIYCLKKRHKS